MTEATKRAAEIIKNAKQKSKLEKKIKSFLCTPINQENLRTIDKEINSFVAIHDVFDIKINTADSKFGSSVIYTVFYKESSDG